MMKGLMRRILDGYNDGLNISSNEGLNVETNVGNRYIKGVHEYVNEVIVRITYDEDVGDIEATNETNGQGFATLFILTHISALFLVFCYLQVLYVSFSYWVATEEINQQENFSNVVRRNTRGPIKMMHI